MLQLWTAMFNFQRWKKAVGPPIKTTALAGERDAAQVTGNEIWPGPQPSLLLQPRDESAWRPPRPESGTEEEPALDPRQTSSLRGSPGNGVFLVGWVLILTPFGLLE